MHKIQNAGFPFWFCRPGSVIDVIILEMNQVQQIVSHPMLNGGFIQRLEPVQAGLQRKEAIADP